MGGGHLLDAERVSREDEDRPTEHGHAGSTDPRPVHRLYAGPRGGRRRRAASLCILGGASEKCLTDVQSPLAAVSDGGDEDKAFDTR